MSHPPDREVNVSAYPPLPAETIIIHHWSKYCISNGIGEGGAVFHFIGFYFQLSRLPFIIQSVFRFVITNKRDTVKIQYIPCCIGNAPCNEIIEAYHHGRRTGQARTIYTVFRNGDLNLEP